MFCQSLLILVLYFTIILTVSELWYFLDKYSSGFSNKSLSNKDLINILQYRGVDLKGVLEKRELLNLVRYTGETSSLEWIAANEDAKNKGKCNLTKILDINSEFRFSEVLASSDMSAWILMKIPSKHLTFSSKIQDPRLSNIWCHIQSTYARYGIGFGILDCDYRYNLCGKLGFYQSPFILVLPNSNLNVTNSNDYSVFPYLTDLTIKETDVIRDSVNEWLKEKLAQKIYKKHIPNANAGFPHFYFVSIYSDTPYLHPVPPLSISAHSVKLSGRIQFWSASAKNIPMRIRDKISSEFSNWKPPGHFFISEYGLIYRYGVREGQIINYNALQLFFRDLFPNSNELLKCSLMILNLFVSFYAAIEPGSKFQKFFGFIWYFLIFNISFCLTFLSFVSCFNDIGLLNDCFNFVFHFWQKIVTLDYWNHIRFLRLNNMLNVYQSIVIWFVMVLVIVCKTSKHIENETILSGNLQSPNHASEIISQNRIPSYQKISNYLLSLRSRLSQSNSTVMFHGSDKCIICQESYKRYEILSFLPCGHGFHMSCIRRWIEASSHGECPLCRQVSPLNELILNL